MLSVSRMATFTTIEKQGIPYKHGITLPNEYIAQNRAGYDEAVRLRGTR